MPGKARWLSALRDDLAIRQQQEYQRHHQICGSAHGWRLLVERSEALSRCLERPDGCPRFATISQYANSKNTNDIIKYARQRMGGAFSWEEVKRYRDAWKGPMA